TTSKTCAGTGWPDPDSLLGCDQPALFPLSGDPAACPALRGSLPCALSMQGIEVCPARTASGIRLMLSKPSSPTPVPLGPADENSWMPALSPNGSRLVFVTQPTHAPSRLMVSFLDHADP